MTSQLDTPGNGVVSASGRDRDGKTIAELGELQLGSLREGPACWSRQELRPLLGNCVVAEGTIQMVKRAATVVKGIARCRRPFIGFWLPSWSFFADEVARNCGGARSFGSALGVKVNKCMVCLGQLRRNGCQTERPWQHLSGMEALSHGACTLELRRLQPRRQDADDGECGNGG